MAPSDLDIRCAACGEMNRLPAGHCKKCGAKLDFNAVERRILGRQHRRQLAAKVRLILAVALGVVSLLVVWPVQLERETGDALDARRYRLKTELMVEALERGIPASQEFSEKEVNAFLAELLAVQPPREGWTPGLDDLAVRLSASQVEALVAVGRGPLTLTAHFTAHTRKSELVLTGVRAGHLPLPGVFGRWYARRQLRLLHQLRNESLVLGHLDGASLSDGTVELLVAPAP